MKLILDIIPKSISDDDMNKLIMDWNLNDNEQQECYRNAVPKQYNMLLEFHLEMKVNGQEMYSNIRMIILCPVLLE